MKGGTNNKMEAYMCYDGCCGSEEGRRFLTKEEKMQKLKKYKELLDSESEGVSERIAELNKKKE